MRLLPLPVVRLSVFAATVWAACAAPPVLAQAGPAGCGPLENSYGPYDYRTEHGEPLQLVEGAHFKPQIEALMHGKVVDAKPGGDIAYTLRAFPNHHRALDAMRRLGEKEKTQRPEGSTYTVECWFERAVRFKPDDTVARMLYASYLSKQKRPAEASQQLALATKSAEDNPFSHYNIGLLYFEIKDYGRALTEAHRALALGFPRMELKQQLVAAGQWKEPPAEPAAASAPTPGSAASAPAS